VGTCRIDYATPSTGQIRWVASPAAAVDQGGIVRMRNNSHGLWSGFLAAKPEVPGSIPGATRLSE
jgi:hypothetical protein